MGAVQALLITANISAIEPFWGVACAFRAAIMAFIPGWLVAIAMLETSGFLWTWFFNGLIDTVILSVMAAGTFDPEGQPLVGKKSDDLFHSIVIITGDHHLTAHTRGPFLRPPGSA